ncbi:HAD hydrolase-like protein [Pseudonocardia endophytica]|uniref:Phosphoglycolate phosphatase n=1 Tax=Pseudonocardia endophytica TaxID=401976 RepID=A0A4R1HR89_PSEEN|nr:HAD hydrolase-like protein [Pseudonocardia endophytica]TCK25097.1 phosphoglycolate phosphatase [Pseudonocardia endophytica]
MLTHVLLDLDGTLVDSAPGILGSLRAALDEVGVEYPTAAVDQSVLGPPMYESIPRIAPDAPVDTVMAAYRRFYLDEGGYALSEPYPGADRLLRELTDAGVRIALSTSKFETSAHKILAARGWTDLFTEIVGDTPDAARPTKGAVVAEALRRLGHPSGPDLPVLVGDRHHDVDGARENGLDCLGAGWGYGLPGELADAGAVAVYASADDLRTALLA